ncbi:MAG TPA: AmmeMemoRadiSam system protein A, partial [bacterium]|nr:AmmeMemoRadiSam system protein A [bacterium]
LTGEPDTLISTIDGLEAEDLANTDTMACGEKGILAVMQMARTLGIPDITLLHQANSGDIEGYGDKDRVVGYGTILFSGGTLAEAEPVDETIPFTGDEVLNAAERQEALVMVRETLRQHLYEGEEAEFTPEQAIFYEPLGAFVTLNEGGNLRGCIGQFEPDQPLWIVLRDMAIAAASEDSRFIPVAPDEFDAIEIEISVLSPMQQITDPYTEIEIGRHGVYVKKNGRSGTYLPQVATDNGWDLETFMNSLCGQKAGIGADSWKDGSAEIYVYSAQVFGE